MTEDEARKRWCPFARTYHVEEDEKGRGAMASVNRGRDGAPDAWCLCIASECMAWRWRFAEDARHPLDEPSSRDGYCGLAGEGR